MRLPSVAAREFEEHGFFITEPLFDATTLAEVTLEIERAWRRRSSGASRHDEFAKVRPELQRLHLESDVLASFCRHESFSEIARALLGPDADLFWNQAYVKGPDRAAGVSAIPWHQDAYYAEVDARAYNCWVAITRTTVDNGTFVRAPVPLGKELLPHVWDKRLLFFRCDVSETVAVPVTLEPGQALVYHGRVPHRSGANTSSEIRVAYSVAFTTASARLRINGEAFGDRVPLLRSGERSDLLLAAYALAEGEPTFRPGAALVQEIEARAPNSKPDLAALLARYRDTRDATLLGRALSLLPKDEEVRGDKVGARTRTEQLFDELDLVRASDPRATRLLLARILELDPANARAREELSRLG